jgi:triosephosphate isomerase (TIM)
MRKQIAAANWKMNLNVSQAEELVNALLDISPEMGEDQVAILAVPYPYILTVKKLLEGNNQYQVAAQDSSANENGAYTGQVSAEMLSGMGIKYAIIGHSERREYNHENNLVLAKKINLALAHQVQPIFCCGEPLPVRNAGTQNEYVTTQLTESLCHLSSAQLTNFIVAYEPIWAIGTGKTASAEQAQEMHAHIRSFFVKNYSNEVAESISILYGGSVKAANAVEIFSQPDVDGGLVGGASLVATEFAAIINGLKKSK